MKKRKIKKLLKQALQQIAGLQMPAGEPVSKPAANDSASEEMRRRVTAKLAGVLPVELLTAEIERRVSASRPPA